MIRQTSKAVITGMGCLSGAGDTLEDNLASLFNAVCNFTAPQRFSTDHVHPYPVFEVQKKGGDPNLPVDPLLSRTCFLMLAAAQEAIFQSGLCKNHFLNKRIGICIGTSVGSTPNAIDFYDDFRSLRSPELGPVHRFLSSNPAACLAREYGTNGPVQTVVNTCSSGTDAIGIASSWISQGLCDVVLAGGADELSRVSYNGFASLMILDPECSKPFDKRRAGLNLGEGAGIMVLESVNMARENGHRVLGKILGYGSACDGYHLVSPHPGGRGLKTAIDQALGFSKTDKQEICFVNAHGTGTLENDRVESIVLADALAGVPFFSTKGCTGHTLGAAGAIEAIYTLACLNKQQIPPSAGFATPALDTPASPVSEALAIEGSIGISQSLAFGGNNSVLVIEGRKN